mmetsp:Transcript_66180/g.104134  ORF Transcript_66180/g.104134 Transcript_66180/m.104134 type:complete len:227 (-) Transcript_66180:283-963(-)
MVDYLGHNQKDDKKPNLFKKTKLCSFFQTNTCRYGEQCDYAHGQAEIESALDLRKTAICVAWVSGKCPLTKAACRFSHGKKDLRPLASPQKGESTRAYGPSWHSAAQAGEQPTSMRQTSSFAVGFCEPLGMELTSHSLVAEPMKVELSYSLHDWRDMLSSACSFAQSFPWDVDTTDDSDSDNKSDPTYSLRPQYQPGSPPPVSLPVPSFKKENNMTVLNVFPTALA